MALSGWVNCRWSIATRHGRRVLALLALRSRLCLSPALRLDGRKRGALGGAVGAAHWGAAIGFATAMRVLAAFRLILLRRLYQLSIISIRFAGVLLIAGLASGAAHAVLMLIGPESAVAIVLSATVFLSIYAAGLALLLRPTDKAVLAGQAKDAEFLP